MMESIVDFLRITVFIFNEQNYTVWQLIMIPLLVLIAWFIYQALSKFIYVQLERSQLPPDVQLLIRRIYVIASLVVVVLVILTLLNVPLGAFAFVSGAVAIGVGFGAQNIINNFISGWILMWEKPIRIGDFLEIGDVKGTVETISTRSTRVRRVDGVHMLIPNSQLLENTVVNWTLMDKLTRCALRVGVAYGSPARKVEELIMRAVEFHPDTMDDPAPKVFFEDFGDSALIFDSYFWIDAASEKDLRQVKSDIRFQIDELFNEAGIVIAFPQQDVHLDGQLRLIRDEK